MRNWIELNAYSKLQAIIGDESLYAKMCFFVVRGANLSCVYTPNLWGIRFFPVTKWTWSSKSHLRVSLAQISGLLSPLHFVSAEWVECVTFLKRIWDLKWKMSRKPIFFVTLLSSSRYKILLAPAIAVCITMNEHKIVIYKSSVYDYDYCGWKYIYNTVRLSLSRLFCWVYRVFRTWEVFLAMAFSRVP